MHYFIILTKECNLLCTYCGGGSDTPPREVSYPIADLQSFLSRDANPVVEFYGGEPLLRIDTMKSIMDAIPARFVVQTNGVFLDRIEPRYLARFHSVLVSIDGSEGVTDKARGKGVYERVMGNLELVRRRGFRGDLVARMTVAQGTSVYENVRHLLGTGLFDHVHWQLDFGMFWEAGQDTEPGIVEWLDAYNSDVSSLARLWVDEMSRSGRVLGIVPFVGVMDSLLSGKKSRLRCGSGIDFFAIVPDGRVSACPVSVDFDFSMVGSIFDCDPKSLCGKATLGEPCASCDILDICGGRCLFVNRSQGLLRENGYSYICSTVRRLVDEMQSALPRVQALIDGGSLSLSDFRYPELNNGCEIIP
ncbi:MAG: TIGR04084 family radical SAM/SPASM domain-containing protein [Nitrososphaerota archaeon]|nr:TIGR04084 family radical SAM/SPASM domain-containing protein [Nitrososphaerota archaeon]